MSIKTITLCALLTVLPAVSAAQHTFKISASNLGTRKVTVSRSFGGVMMPLHQPIDFKTDSSITYQLGSNLPEHFFVVVDGKTAKDDTKSISLYPAETSVNLTVDPNDGLLCVDNYSEALNAATKASEIPYELFVEYVTRTGDRLNLKNDTSAASFEKKIMNLADSLTSVINEVREPVRNVLRQEMALNTLYLWNELYFGRINRMTDRNSPEAATWNLADRNITDWARLDNEANALSLLFDDVASSEWSKHLTDSQIDSFREGGAS